MTQPVDASSSEEELPDHVCVWCQKPMKKRLVAEGRFLHYTCPRCLFQQTRNWNTPSFKIGSSA